MTTPTLLQAQAAERAQKIRDRLEAAAPGPWHACGVYAGVVTGLATDPIGPRRHKNGACSCGFVWSKPADVPVMEVTGGVWGDRYPAIRRLEDGTLEPFMDGIDYGEVPREMQAANMKFIAEAPTDIAWLLSEHDLLTARVSELEGALTPAALAALDRAMICARLGLEDHRLRRIEGGRNHDITYVNKRGVRWVGLHQDEYDQMELADATVRALQAAAQGDSNDA